MVRNRKSSQRNTEVTNTGDDMEEEIISTNWIDQLNRRELETELKKWNLETVGTVAEMRKRLRDFGERFGNGRRSPSTSVLNNQETRTATSRTDMEETRKLLNQVRKWGLFYNGKSGHDAVKFLEKLEDLREEYGIEDLILLRALPELFKDQASIWFRINKNNWSTWNEFLKEFRSFYFPENYYDNLEEEISSRKQRYREKGKDYILSVQYLMTQHGGYGKEKMLQILYKNLDPRYKYYIRKNDVSDLSTLLKLVEEFEKVDSEIKNQGHGTVGDRRVTFSNGPGQGHGIVRERRLTFNDGTTTRSGFSRDSNRETVRNENRETNMVQENRNSSDGIRSRTIYCFGCGREGITLRNCSCQRTMQGNDRRTGQNRDVTSSPRN